jgi:hypothetical protein
VRCAVRCSGCQPAVRELCLGCAGAMVWFGVWACVGTCEGACVGVCGGIACGVGVGVGCVLYAASIIQSTPREQYPTHSSLGRMGKAGVGVVGGEGLGLGRSGKDTLCEVAQKQRRGRVGES